MKHLKRLEEEISRWPHISVHSHRFGGREFRFQSAEVRNVHTGGIVDIPFPRSVRDALLAEGLAEEHRLSPQFRSLLERFALRTASHASAEPLPA